MTIDSPSSYPDHQRIRGEESRMEFALAGLMSVLIIGTLYYVYTLFAPLVPEAHLNRWAIFTGFVTFVMLCVPIAFYATNPSDEMIERFWSPLGKLVAILFDLAVASSVWLLLPYASEPLRLLMVIFYSAAISGQVISTAESTGTILFGVISVFGSAALFFYQTETLYAVPLSLFLLAFGGLMIAVAFMLKKAIRTAIRLRIEAEKISFALAESLGETQFERDARTRFIAAASHDLRQPLQAANLFLRQIGIQAEGPKRTQAIEGVRRGLAEANALLESLADHLRVENGAVVPAPEQVALARLIGALIAEMQPAAQHAQIDLRALVAPGATAIADPALVNRIVRNLIHNAITHAQCARIRVIARQRAMAEICVIDDGIGIDLARQDSYFAAYSQGPSGQRHGGGSGLGLSIARELVELMGGTLTLRPPLGSQGLHLRLTLPAAD